MLKINFYNTSTQRKPRKIVDNLPDGSDSKNSNSKKSKNNINVYYFDNVETNNNLRDAEIDKLYLEKNKVSSSIQTDKKFTDDESD